MKHLIAPTVASLALLALGCDITPQTTDAPATGPTVSTYQSCSYSDQDTYPVGSDPTTDFTATNVLATDQVLSTNCSTLYVGEIATTWIDSISRSGSVITFSNAGESDTMQVTGTTLSHAPLIGCVQGVSIQGTLTQGYVTSAGDEIVLQWSWILTKDNCRLAALQGSGTSSGSGGVTPTPTSTPTPTPSPTAGQMEPTSDGSHNLIFLNSQSGDWVGGGLMQTFDLGTGDTFTATKNYDNGVSITYESADNSHWWYLDFASGDNTPLVAGTTYTGAQRFAFKAPGAPGIDVSGDGRGCNTDSGSFTVLDVSYGSGTTINSFWVEFTQHCEGGTPALFGSVRFNAGPPTQ